MKVVCLLFLIAAVAYGQEINSEIRHQFADFVREFGKQYESDEYFRRMTIFTQSLRHMDEHNQGNHGWMMGINQFSDMTAEEMNQPAFKGQDIARSCLAHGVTANIAQHNNLPTDFDWRDKGVVSKVKDQAQCGSCWAFSTVQALESAHAIKTGELLILSPQVLVDCSDACAPEPPYGNVCNQGCGGGWPWSALYDVYLWGGVATEDQYPYTGRTGTCQRDPSTMQYVPVSNYTCLSAADASQSPADEDDMASFLLNNGPLSIALAADSLSPYKSGIWNPSFCSTTRVDHAVLIVGFGEENGQKYWTVKNSWGASWGEEGYFRIVRGENKCGLATGVTFPQVI